MSQPPAADAPFEEAVRSHERLKRALERIIGAAKTRPVRTYADIDPLGQPIVVIGPIDAALADLLSAALEGWPLHNPESDPACP
jgi:hypothetical protein